MKRALSQESEKTMKVTFVLATLSFSGGHRVIFDYARHLHDQGHIVEVVYPLKDRTTLKGMIKKLVKNQFGGKSQNAGHPQGYDSAVSMRRGKTAGKLTGQDFPDADIVVAGWWETVEWLAPLPASKGIKVHFVQGHEVFSWLPVDRVKAVYRKPWPKITVSNWLTTIMQSEYQNEAVVCVPNGVNLTTFAGHARSPNSEKRVGMVWSDAEVKNSKGGIEAILQLKKQIPSLRACIFGSTWMPKRFSDLDWIDFHYQPDQASIPSLYVSCDLWLFSSQSEGFGLPILEAMAMHTPVVATPAGAAPDLVDGTNGVLCDCTPESMAEAMHALLLEPEAKWRERSAAARKTAQANGLDAAAANFENALKQILVMKGAEN